MPLNPRSAAKRFALYRWLTFFGRWSFERLLKRAFSDEAFLERLLQFERSFQEKSWDEEKIYTALLYALRWYNRELGDERLADRLSAGELPGMLPVIFGFFARGQALHPRYRDLAAQITRAGVGLASHHPGSPGFTTEWFRLQVVDSAWNLQDSWSRWDRWHPHLERGGMTLLKHLEAIASQVGDPGLFTRYRAETAKFFSARGWATDKLPYLETIASQVKDAPAFEDTFQVVVPEISLEATAAVAAVSKGPIEFQAYLARVRLQMRQWGSSFTYVFRKMQSAADLERLLTLLENLREHPRMRRYSQAVESLPDGLLKTHLASALHSQKDYLFQDCNSLDWSLAADVEKLIKTQIDQFEDKIIRPYLGAIWHSFLSQHKVRWELEKFTDYVPYEMKDLDWARDSDKTRAYWSSEAAYRDLQCFTSALTPLLLLLLRRMDFPELDKLFKDLPTCLHLQFYQKSVPIPVAWEKGTVYQEGYAKWVGFYDEEVTVARPTAFAEQEFTFTRVDWGEATAVLEGLVHQRAAHKT